MLSYQVNLSSLAAELGDVALGAAQEEPLLTQWPAKVFGLLLPLEGINHVMCCLSLWLLCWHVSINLVLQGHWGTLVINGTLKAPKSKLIDICILYIHQEREIHLCSYVYSFCWKPETNITSGYSDPDVLPHFSSCQTRSPVTPSTVQVPQRIQQGFQVKPSQHSLQWATAAKEFVPSPFNRISNHGEPPRTKAMQPAAIGCGYMETII